MLTETEQNTLLAGFLPEKTLLADASSQGVTRGNTATLPLVNHLPFMSQLHKTTGMLSGNSFLAYVCNTRRGAPIVTAECCSEPQGVSVVAAVR